MKKLYAFTLFLLTTVAFAAPLQDNDPMLDFDKARKIYVKKTYLKNAKKRLSQLQRKIKILEERQSLSKKNKANLELLTQKKNKIQIWQKDVEFTQDRINAWKENTGWSLSKATKADEKMRILAENYEKLTGEKYPKDLGLKIELIYNSISSKRKTSVKKTK